MSDMTLSQSLRGGACALALVVVAIASPALAQFTAPPGPISDTTPGRTAESDAKKGDMLGDGGKIMGGSALDQVQYDIKKRNAMFDRASTDAAIAPEDMVKAMGVGVTLVAADDPYWDGKASGFNPGLLH